MKLKLILGLLTIAPTGCMYANTWNDIWKNLKIGVKSVKDVASYSGSTIKAYSWDSQPFGYKHGGKVIITTLTAIIIADELYTWHVNKNIKKLIEQDQANINKQKKQDQADYLGISLQQYLDQNEYIPYTPFGEQERETAERKLLDLCKSPWTKLTYNAYQQWSNPLKRAYEITVFNHQIACKKGNVEDQEKFLTEGRFITDMDKLADDRFNEYVEYVNGTPYLPATI